MSEILYIQTEKNVEVQSPEIYLQDVAKLTCKDSKVLNRNKVRKVFSIPNGEPGRYVVSAVDLVHAIAKEEPNVDITHIGEANLVVTYEKAKHQQKWYSWLKTLLVCVLTFFGGAFSIMTFNTDVDTANLFSKIYTQFTGEIMPQVLRFWNLLIRWELELVLFFSLTILGKASLRRTRLRWKYRCGFMRMT